MMAQICSLWKIAQFYEYAAILCEFAPMRHLTALLSRIYARMV